MSRRTFSMPPDRFGWRTHGSFQKENEGKEKECMNCARMEEVKEKGARAEDGRPRREERKLKRGNEIEYIAINEREGHI